MSLSSTWSLTENAVFQGRITAAIYKAAADIINSDEPSDTSRFLLAKNALRGPRVSVTDFIWEIASNPAVAAAAEISADNVVDSDIEYIVATAWDKVAVLRFPVTDSPVVNTGGEILEALPVFTFNGEGPMP